MDFFETIETRKTVRTYLEDMPSDEDLTKIADAGRLAPSATNTQNWKFIAIKDKNIMSKMKDAIDAKYNSYIEKTDDTEVKSIMKRYNAHSTFFTKAPIVFAIVETERGSSFDKLIDKNDKVREYRPDSSLLSMGAAIENMSLAAHNLGYGTCWMVAPLVAGEDFVNILNLEKNSRVITLLALGKPAPNNAKRADKKDLSEVFVII